MSDMRILLKLSGEILGSGNFGIDPEEVSRVAHEIKDVITQGIEIGVVLGGGNLFRGESLSAIGLDKVTGDHIGMLATVMNGLAMRDILQKEGVATRLMSSIPILGVAEVFDHRLAVESLGKKEVVVMVGGTGNPFFTTDSCACLRAVEIGAQYIFKATKVDYVYDVDPMRYANAKKFDSLTYDQVLLQDIRVMDHTAICLARDNKKHIRVFNVLKKDNLLRAVKGEVGTLIHV